MERTKLRNNFYRVNRVIAVTRLSWRSYNAKTYNFSEIYVLYVVDPRGIEPRTRLCHSRVLPLYHGPVRHASHGSNSKFKNQISKLQFKNLKLHFIFDILYLIFNFSKALVPPPGIGPGSPR